LSRLSFIIASILFSSSVYAGDDGVDWGNHDPYSESLSGYIRGEVEFQDSCFESDPQVMQSVFVSAEEVVSLGKPRRMIESIDKHKFIFDNREPYRDYNVSLVHGKENFVIKSIHIPAYNSQTSIKFAFDCTTLMDQIWNARRERANERSEKKKKKDQDAKHAKNKAKAKAEGGAAATPAEGQAATGEPAKTEAAPAH
jgi:hypothetical protein